MPTNLHLREHLEEFGRALGLEAVPGIASPLDVPFDLDLRLDLSAKRVSCNASNLSRTIKDLHLHLCCWVAVCAQNYECAYIGSPNQCATQQAIGKQGGKRFPLPNTYRTILNRHCELQDPIDARSLSILAQVGLHQMHILKARISF